MDLKTARSLANNALDIIIKNQPNLIASQENTHLDGAAVAKFCSGFIETYADYLINRSKSEN